MIELLLGATCVLMGTFCRIEEMAFFYKEVAVTIVYIYE